MKRLFDLVVSLLLLVALAPVFLLVALLLLAFQGRPILFSQERPGKNARLFRLYKFRSMVPLREGANPLTDRDRMRVTPLGRFLRSTSLDELPGLWNVLRGDMSLVGPRPLLKEYLPLYNKEQARRHAVRPGITGWAQVNGRNQQTWEERFRLDLWYIDHRSFALDLKILARTLGQVFSRKGVDENDRQTKQPFRG